MRSNVQTIDIAGGLTADSSEDSATYDDVLIEYRLSNLKGELNYVDLFREA